MPGAWVFAVVGPADELARLCDAYPVAHPVRFVRKMHDACRRWGVALETRAGCVRLSVPDPKRPGKPLKLWFPLEALRAFPPEGGGGGGGGGGEGGEAGGQNVSAETVIEASRHRVRLLGDQRLVKALCDTLPESSPVRFVRSIGRRCGAVGALVESRGEIVKVRFDATAAEEAGGSPRRSFATWLPCECVEIVTPWE